MSLVNALRSNMDKTEAELSTKGKDLEIITVAEKRERGRANKHWGVLKLGDRIQTPM